MTAKTAILYARVSTAEQARKGYSLGQQTEALREWATAEGYRVVEEVVDAGESGSYLERAGMDRVRDLVQAGGVSVVVAQDADRISRDPLHRALLDEEMERYGTRLFALDDWGDDSHEGELLKYLKGWNAKGERLKMAERTRRGRLRKVRSGKVHGASLQPRYGFSRVKNADGRTVGYEVNPETMAHVRRIFAMLAGGESLHAVQRELEQGGVPAPSGGRQWSRTTIKNAAIEDVYMPRTHEELRGLVSADVFAGLDPEKHYGVSWFGQRKTSYKPGGGKKRLTEMQPRESWTGVPVDVTDSGLDRATVERARASVVDNRSPSKAGDRDWPLSGVLFCADCNRRLISYRRARPDEGFRNYYRCRPGTTLASCENRRSHRAEELEMAAAMIFERHVGGGKLLELYDQAVAEHDRRRGLRGSPERLAALSQRLESLARKRAGFQEQQAEGLMSISELRDRLSEIEEEREGVTSEMRASEDAAEELHKRRAARETVRQLIHQGQGYLLEGAAEQNRRYRQLGIRFEIGTEGKLTLRLEIGSEGMDSLRSKRTSY